MSPQMSDGYDQAKDGPIFRWIDVPQEIRDLILEQAFAGETFKCVESRLKSEAVEPDPVWPIYNSHQLREAIERPPFIAISRRDLTFEDRDDASSYGGVNIGVQNQTSRTHSARREVEGDTSGDPLKAVDTYDTASDTHQYEPQPAEKLGPFHQSSSALLSQSEVPVSPDSHYFNSILPHRRKKLAFLRRHRIAPDPKDVYKYYDIKLAQPSRTPTSSPENTYCGYSRALAPKGLPIVPPYNLVFAMSVVGKAFASSADVQKALLRTAHIRLNGSSDVERFVKRLDLLKFKSTCLNITVSEDFLPFAALGHGIVGLAINRAYSRNYAHNTYMQKLSHNLGTYKITLVHDRPLFLSMNSAGDTDTRIFQEVTSVRKEATDFTQHFQDGTMSEIEAETMVLNACKPTNVNDLGHTLGLATKAGVEVHTVFKIIFLARPNEKVIQEVNNARFNTRSWCLEFEIEGRPFKIPQTMSKECFQRGLVDIKDLLGKLKRQSIMVKVRNKEGIFEDHWTYWYKLPRFA